MKSSTRLSQLTNGESLVFKPDTCWSGCHRHMVRQFDVDLGFVHCIAPMIFSFSTLYRSSAATLMYQLLQDCSK